MSNMNGNDPNRLLNEVRNIDNAINELQGDLDHLKMMQNRAADDTTASSGSNASTPQKEAERLSNMTFVKYQQLGERVKKLKTDPESGNPRNAPQIGKVDRRLRTMIQVFQQQDKDFRKKQQDSAAREYRIVRPDASEAEVREAVEAGGQIFSQAVCILISAR
jgi:syntaxin 1B/2/3